MRFSSLMPLQCSLHLKPMVVFRGHKMCADQQENNTGIIQMDIDLLRSFLTGTNLSIMPGSNQSAIFQVAQVLLQMVPESFISLRIREEDIRTVCLFGSHLCILYLTIL